MRGSGRASWRGCVPRRLPGSGGALRRVGGQAGSSTADTVSWADASAGAQAPNYATGSGGVVAGDGDGSGEGEDEGDTSAMPDSGGSQGTADGTDTMDATDPPDGTPGQTEPPSSDPGGPQVGDNGGVCGGDTPHGCYSLAPNQIAECPEQSPELPWKYAGCNGVAPAAACSYQNAGKMFDCICDTGVHWLCFYVD